MKWIIAAAVTLSLALSVPLRAADEQAAECKPQTQCPLCGMDINKELYRDYEGKRIYFGCAGCPPRFDKDPEAVMKKLAESGQCAHEIPSDSTELDEGQAQTQCPICGMGVNKELYRDYKGKRIYFGCAGCPARFDEDPEKWISKLEEQGVELEDSPAEGDGEGDRDGDEEREPEHVQVHCPTCDAKLFAHRFYSDYEGKRIYFCCPHCRAKFEKDPESFMKRAKEKGYKFEDVPEE